MLQGQVQETMLFKNTEYLSEKAVRLIREVDLQMTILFLIHSIIDLVIQI